MLVRYISVECVSKVKSILSIIFRVIYGAVRIQLTHSLMMIEGIRVFYFIIIIKTEIWAIAHGWVMEQWYALYVFLYSYWNYYPSILSWDDSG